MIDARGRILARSLTLGAGLLPEDRLARAARVSGATGFENISLGGQPYRLFAAPIALSGPAGGGAVLVASDTSDISQTTSHIGLLVVLIGAGAALLAALLAAALTRRGLRPLRRLAAGAGEIERTADPSQRLPSRGAADEIGQLTGVLNHMLASLEAARAGERRFLADASHELRTPVTTLLGNVEFAVRHGADPEVLEELQRDARRLARLVDDLLVLERGDAGVSSAARLTSVRSCVGSRRSRFVGGRGGRWPGRVGRSRSCARARRSECAGPRAREPGRECSGPWAGRWARHDLALAGQRFGAANRAR